MNIDDYAKTVVGHVGSCAALGGECPGCAPVTFDAVRRVVTKAVEEARLEAIEEAALICGEYSDKIRSLIKSKKVDS